MSKKPKQEVTQTTPALDGVVIPPVRRPGSLTSVRGIRRELARTYRDSRQGLLHSDDLGKFVYALSHLAKIVQDESWETRLVELEKKLKGQGQ